MDAIEILGGLLGRKTQSAGSSSGGSGLGGIGGKILKDILFGGPKQPQPAPRSAPQPQSSPSGGWGSGSVSTGSGAGSRSMGRGDLAAQARELEDLLNVAGKRKSGGSAASGSRSSGASSFEQPKPGPVWQQPQPTNSPFSKRAPAPPQNQNEHALVLVRAMINAAKADGQISQDEQQAILQQVGDSSAETVGFLRQEFNKPLDVREFAWSVPQGLEEQVYALSLMAIDLDKQSEAEYLFDLSHALRLPAETCREIHERYGAPVIHQ